MFFYIISIVLFLLSVLDLRRGFIFSSEQYILRTPFFVFSFWQIGLIALSIAFYFLNKLRNKKMSSKENQKLFCAIFAILILDLFFYRGIAVSKLLIAQKINIDWLSGFGFEGLLKPLGITLSYLLTVWHATFISLLISGLTVLVLPLVQRKIIENSNQTKSIFWGLLASLTQPLCSCCSAISNQDLFKNKKTIGFGLSMLMGAPLLNISTLILSFNLLPLPYFFIRFLGGIALTLGTSFIVSAILQTQFDQNLSPNKNSIDNLTVNEIMNLWIKYSLKSAQYVLPGLVFGTFLTSILWLYWPSNTLDNNLSSVILVSIFSTFLMISTWTEIPITLLLIAKELPGPAASALIALPSINIASLFLVKKSTGSWKTSILISTVVIFSSIGIGYLLL